MHFLKIIDGPDFIFNKQISMEVHIKVDFLHGQLVCSSLTLGEMKLQLKTANLLGIEAVCMIKYLQKWSEITVFDNLISIFA